MLVQVKHHFPFIIIIYNHHHHHHHHNFHFIFINTTSYWGEFSKWIRAACSTPTQWLLWVSCRVNIIIIFSLNYSLVTTIEVFMPSFVFITSINYYTKKTKDVSLSCRYHLSNSQIVSPVQNILERITCLWLCANLCTFVIVAIAMLFNSVFLFSVGLYIFLCLLFLFVFFSGYLTESLCNWSSNV